ncbi:DUF2059 domain-containing protein [Duganella sp. BJB1802]|uniref:DUF2059 domain-containing protein n=1 Tax=Duganella sp. BJB1802 TaxID=2744575 RepID=UPI001594BB28|nr:DUF2059 domain-containing protein [Duganella sp. BJB1802]NVD73101.1 DUF2059 domain-containing protein [Duganella sp. BJB1802]
MKKIVISIVAAFALAGAAPAFAQADAASTAAARELFEAMSYRTMMTGIMQQMSLNIGQSMRAGAEAAIKGNPKTTPEQKAAEMAKMEAELPAVVSTLQGVITDPGMIEEIMTETVPLYARTYSADELKQITAFYRTPIGAKMLATMPKLMAEAMQIGQQIAARRVGPVMQKLQEKQNAK